MPDSRNIPAMFGRVYTASPPEVFWDMYENDTTFDEATKNQLDREMDLNFDTFEDLLGGSVEDDEFAVEKAIYQKFVEDGTGRDVSGINTPYGPGLDMNQIEELIIEFPGIEAGIDLEFVNESFDLADTIVDEASEEINSIINNVEEKTYEEGQAGNESNVFRKIGKNISNAPLPLLSMGGGGSGNIGDLVDGFKELASATTNIFRPFKPLSPIVDDLADLAQPLKPLSTIAEDAVDLADQLSVEKALQPLGPWRDLFTWGNPEDRENEDLVSTQISNATIDSFEQNERTEDETIVIEIFEELFNSGATGEQIAGEIQDLLEDGFVNDSDVGIAFSSPEVRNSQAVRNYTNGNLIGDLEEAFNLGGDPGDLNLYGFNPQGPMGSPGGGAPTITASKELTPEQNAWVADNPDHYLTKNPALWATLMNRFRSGDTPEEALNYIGLMGSRDPQYDAAGAAGTGGGAPMPGDSDVRITGTTTTRTAADLTPEGQATLKSARTEADAETETVADFDEDVLREDLQKVFYTQVYAQPGGGRSDIQGNLPDIYSQTRTLFFLFQGAAGYGLYKNASGKAAMEGLETPSTKEQTDAKNTLEDDYRAFLQSYFVDPQQYRSGEWLRSKINLVNNMLTKMTRFPEKKRISEGGNWTDAELRESVWIEGLFSNRGSTTGAQALATKNRENLIKMAATKGRTGYYSSIIQGSVGNLMAHYRKMGQTEQQIFARMTAIYGQPPERTPDNPITAAVDATANLDGGAGEDFTGLIADEGIGADIGDGGAGEDFTGLLPDREPLPDRGPAFTDFEDVETRAGLIGTGGSFGLPNPWEEVERAAGNFNDISRGSLSFGAGPWGGFTIPRDVADVVRDAFINYGTARSGPVATANVTQDLFSDFGNFLNRLSRGPF